MKEGSKCKMKKLDFSYVEFPCTVDLNTFKAYFNLSDVILPKVHGKSLPASDDGEDEQQQQQQHQPKSLRHTVLDSIVENWNDLPLFKEVPRQEDRNYVVSNLDVGLPLPLLSAHIRADFFWRKSYQHRWRTLPHRPAKGAKPWINIYMERHLQEFIENLETADYEPMRAQATLDICAAYINQLEINYLQPTKDGTGNDHIPLDFILSNLPELRTLRLTYCTRTVGTNFFLGCNLLSSNDIRLLAHGLSRCHELEHFCLHSNKLDAYQLRYIARSLDKGCHHLTTLSFVHCNVGDAGIREFVQACSSESFGTLRTLDLTDNKISAEGAYLLSRAFRGLNKLEKLVLRLNPIQSDGAAAIFSVLHKMPLRRLDLSTCWITESITRLLMHLVVQNKTLKFIDLCNNEMGEEFGRNLYKVIGFNKTLRRIDLRNAGLSLATRNKLKDVLLENASRQA